MAMRRSLTAAWSRRGGSRSASVPFVARSPVSVERLFARNDARLVEQVRQWQQAWTGSFEHDEEEKDNGEVRVSLPARDSKEGKDKKPRGSTSSSSSSAVVGAGAGSNNSTTVHAVGRRKEAVATVWLKKDGSGQFFVVNKARTLVEYFDTARVLEVLKPLRTVQAENKFDVEVTVDGGGLSGQAGAVRLGLARALVMMNPTWRDPLKEAGFLTRDARVVERKKPGQPKARKKFQWAKR